MKMEAIHQQVSGEPESDIWKNITKHDDSDDSDSNASDDITKEDE